jgi:hypothetical protein
MRTSQVNASRLRTFFELIGCAAQFVPKIPELLRRNRGNEEALFSALSKRYVRRCAVVFLFATTESPPPPPAVVMIVNYSWSTHW